jgi:hypothetical protein
MYGSVYNWIIVYEKTYFTKTNEKRDNIYNAKFATYLANKLRVIKIIDKFICSMTTDKVSFDHFNELIQLKVNFTVKPKKHWIICYKSYEVAHYQDIPLPGRSIPYVGKHKSWYDNGKISSEGDYYNGEKNGKWQYWYNNGDINKPEEKSFSVNYHNGEINMKIFTDDLKMIKKY